jgi:DNA invertase Pin-like site-specific DNA recombinase
MKDAVLYVRVSSKEQKEEGYSIPAQLKLLRKYAKEHGFRVVQEFEEVETAKKAGRATFGKMLRFLKKTKSIEHILVEKTDRLYRNFPDLVKIDELNRTLHFVKEGQIISKDSKSHEKLMHDIKVVMAKNYTDNLSEETSKGMREKAEQGLWPSYAPLGYLNNKETGGIDIDFIRAPVIREMFEAYGYRRASLRDIKHLADNRGYRTRQGRKVTIDGLGKMLDNPIYIGDFLWKGKYYEGKHDPIISRDLFELVQKAKHSKHRPRKNYLEFAFRGLLVCGYCGCLITAEIKKGKYIYYRCTKSKGKCPGKPIREEKLADMIGEHLKRLKLPPERVNWVIDALKESSQDKDEFRRTEIKRLQAEYEKIETHIRRLYDDRLNGIVDENFWKFKYNELKSRLTSIKQSLAEHDIANFNYLEDGIRLLELSQKAHGLYIRRESFKQRKMLDILLSNCVLTNGKVEVEFREVFKSLADGAAEEEKLIQQKAPKSDRNKIWLPGLVSGSAVMWDQVILNQTRLARGRLAIQLSAG